MARKNIIIAGAGFGGITSSLILAKKIGNLRNEYEIILIDRHHHQLYTPALYEIAAIPRESVSSLSLKSSILIPINDIVSGKSIKFICDEVIGLESKERRVILKNLGEIPYEYLTFALGSETNYFGIPGLQEHSFPLKTFDDAARLRNTIEDTLRKKEALKIVVGGAGASGVELVAEFVNFVCILKEKILPAVKVCNVEFLLIEAAPDILPGFDSWIINKTKKRLGRLGIRLKTSTSITNVSWQQIELEDGSQEPYDIFIWAGGVKGPSLFEKLNLPLSSKGALQIDEYLQVRDAGGRILAIGDNSSFTNPHTGKPLVWNVPVAEEEGKLAAENILRAIQGREKKKFVPWTKYPYVLVVGGRYAIADLIYIRFWGILGLAAKALVELRYLLFILPPVKAFRTWAKAVHYYSLNN